MNPYPAPGVGDETGVEVGREGRVVPSGPFGRWLPSVDAGEAVMSMDVSVTGVPGVSWPHASNSIRIPQAPAMIRI